VRFLNILKVFTAPTKMAPVAPDGEGNTISSPHRIASAKLWCFTYHIVNGSMAPEKLGFLLGALGEYGFGEEVMSDDQ